MILPISADGFRGGTRGGGAISSSGLSLIGSGLPANEEEFLSRPPPFDSLSSFSEISDNDNDAPCFLAGELIISNDSDDIDDKEIFLPLVLDFDVLIPGDFNEMSVFRGCEKRQSISKQAGCYNRPFSYSTKESGSSDIFIHFYTRGSIEWR